MERPVQESGDYTAKAKGVKSKAGAEGDPAHSGKGRFSTQWGRKTQYPGKSQEELGQGAIFVLYVLYLWGL